MSKKGLLKFMVAFGFLTVVLIYLGVNYVPRVSALNPANANLSNVRSDISPDYIERHLPAVVRPVFSTSPDWVERHPPAAAKPMNAASPDWIERHTSKNYSSSDWIERHLEQSSR